MTLTNTYVDEIEKLKGMVRNTDSTISQELEQLKKLKDLIELERASKVRVQQQLGEVRAELESIRGRSDSFQSSWNEAASEAEKAIDEK